MAVNSAELSNGARLRLASLFIDVSRLPVPGVQAIVYSYASVEEREPRLLAARRAESVTQFLSQLGVTPSDTYVESKVVQHVKDGQEGSDQIDVQFSPTCPPGGCGYLCATPIER